MKHSKTQQIERCFDDIAKYLKLNQIAKEISKLKLLESTKKEISPIEENLGIKFTDEQILKIVMNKYDEIKNKEAIK